MAAMANGPSGGVFVTLADLQASKPRENTRLRCIERGNAEYIAQPHGYVATFGDVTTSTLIAKLVIKNTTVDVANFGAVGVGDEGSAINDAISAINALGGGQVNFSKPLYQTSVAWVANTGVLLKSPSLTDVGSNTNGTNSSATKTVIRWIGTAGKTIYSIAPENTGDAVWGGGSEGIEFDCNNLANVAVHLNNTKYSVFDGKVRQAALSGIILNSSSGSAAVFSSNNNIRNYEYIWGTQPATENSIGLLIQGNGSTAPSTQQKIGHINGLVKNGYLVQIEESDNCQFNSVMAVVQSPGTGGALRIKDGGFGPANSNQFWYVVGKVTQDPTIYGTALNNYQSEGGTIDTFGGTGARWDAELFDYVTGKRFKSHVYSLRDKTSVTSGEFLGSSSGIGSFALNWNARTLNGTATSDVSVVIPNKYNFSNGFIEGIELVMGNNAVASGNYRLTCRTSVGVTAGITVTPDSTLTDTVAAPVQYVPTVHTFNIDPDISFADGDHIFLTIQRLGADALDTNTDDLFILGARVLYRSLGPDSIGSGTYDIPEW